MYKKVILLIAICTSTYLQGQIDQSLKNVLPKVIDVSPEAASLGQYGGLPVNLYTGKLNQTINLYTIEVGEFKFPLTLSYNYGGFKPDTDPTMVGLGWTANFGGAVIRQLKGLPDEDSSGGYFLRGNLYENIDSLSVAGRVEALKHAANGNWDTRPDKLIVNSFGINGTFRFTSDKVPIFTPHRNYKVKINNSLGNWFDWFEVYDERGVKYDFSVIESVNSWDWDTDDETDYWTSWMINKIEVPHSNGVIDFQYDNYTVHHKTYRRIKSVKGYGSYEQTDGFSNHFNDNTIHSKIIKRIDFPNGYIIFDQEISAYPSAPDWVNSDRVKLKGMSVYNANDGLIQKYVFDYYDYGYYYFLKSIKKENSLGEQVDYYDFEYLNLNQMPTERIINDKVDYWGYYNGDIFSESDPEGSLQANFNYGKIGALSKIIYPTKGYTDIIYEANTVRKLVGSPTPPSSNVTEFISITPAEASDDCDYKELVVNIPVGEVTLTSEVNVTAEGSWAKCTLKDMNGNDITYSLGKTVGITASEEGITADGGDYHQIKSETIILGAGSYKLYVDICDNLGVGQDLLAKIAINYREEEENPGPHELNANVGGVRVAETIDCPNTSDDCVSKKYKYAKRDSNETSGFLIEPYPRLKEYSTRRRDYYFDVISGDPSFIEDTDGSLLIFTSYATEIDEYNYHVESYYPLSPITYLGNHVAYTRVEVYNKDTIQGKVVNDYTTRSRILEDTKFPDLYKEVDYKSGKLKRQRVFGNDGGQYVERKDMENSYADHLYYDAVASNDFRIIRYPVDITCINTYTGRVAHDNEYRRFLIESVNHQAEDYSLTQSNVSITEAGGIGLSISTSYLYNDIGLVAQKEISNSNAGTLRTEFKYPNDLVGTEQAPYLQQLVDSNRVAEPVIASQYMVDSGGRSLKLSESHKKYRSSIETNNYLLLVESHARKGKGLININTGIDKLIEYLSYDSYGNPTELKKVGGATVVYLWGYNGQYPVAKIENATYAEVINTGVDLTVLDGTSSSEIAKFAELNKIRNHPTMSDAMVTTFTYAPLVGVTSITDHKGQTISYEYDPFNRLEFIKDDTNDLLEEYQYHYKGE